MQIMKFLFILFTISFSLAGCNSTYTSRSRTSEVASAKIDGNEWKLLTGKWYGKQPIRNGGSREWLVTRESNGVYAIEFLITDGQGKKELTKEIGDWGVSGGIYFTIFKGWQNDEGFKPAVPQDQWTRNAYKIVSLNSEEFIYSDLEDNDSYRVIRVPKDFELK